MNTQEDPFASVRLKSNRQSVSNEYFESIPKNQDDPFSAVRLKKVEGFSGLYETGRHAARVGSRIAETIGGIPGDISSLIQSGVFSGLEKLTGIPTSEEVRQEVKKQRLPTSQELKEFSQEQTGGFTKPQSEYEKIGDEIAQTAASLFGPMKFRKALGVSIGSQAAKEGLKIAGLGEGSQESGKLGTMFMMTMFNPKGALNYASKQYDKAFNLSKGASISAKNLGSNLQSLKGGLLQGVTTPAKNIVLKPTEELLSKIKNGKIPVQELTAAKRDINTLMGDPILLKRERNLLKVLAKNIDEAIKPYEKVNPKFGKAYRPANEIYGAVMQGNKASNFIKKTLGTKSILTTALAEAALGHAEYILPTISGAAGALGTAKTFDFFTRLSKSPQLQKFYSKAMLAAVKEDSGALRIYEKEIEDILKND